jgi:hypothetical protein
LTKSPQAPHETVELRASPGDCPFFLNGRNRDFGEKYLPTNYLDSHPNIAIFYSGFSLVKIEDENDSRVRIRNRKTVGKWKIYKIIFM